MTNQWMEIKLKELEKRVKVLEQDSILDKIRSEIEQLPSVSTEKTGRWRHYEGMLICSKCGSEFYDDIMEYCGDDVPKCCPDCGAKMQEE